MKRLLRKNTFGQAVVIIFVFDSLTRILGFLKNVVIAAQYGFSKLTDAFNYAFTLINTPINLISDALLAGLIPFLHEKKTEQEKVNFTYSVFIVLSIFMIVFFGLILIFFNPVMNVIAPGFESTERSYVFEISVFLILAGFFLIYSKTIESYFRSEKIFGISNVSNFVGNLIVFTIILLFAKMTYKVIVYAPLIGAAVAAVIMFIAGPKKFTRFDKQVFKLVKFSIPVVLGGSLGIINNFIDKGFATILEEGNLTALTYSYQLVLQFRYLAFGTITGAAYTFISKEITDRQWDKVQKRTDNLVNAMFSIFVIAVFTFLSAGYPGVRLLFHYGLVDMANIDLLIELTAIYLGTAIFAGLTNLMVQIFYSLKETKIPTLVSSGAIVLNVILNYLFIHKFGAYALATATLISAVLVGVIDAIIIKRKYNVTVFRFKHIFIGLLSIAALFAYVLFDLKDRYLIDIGLLVGAILYIRLTKIFDWNYLRSLIRKREVPPETPTEIAEETLINAEKEHKDE